jgi:hypothetical protein
MEDYVIGNKIKTNVFMAAAAGTNNITIPPRANRIGMRLTARATSSGQLGSLQNYNGIATTVGAPITIANIDFDANIGATPPIDSNIWNVGEIIKGPLVLSATLGVIFAIETYVEFTIDSAADYDKIVGRNKGAYEK